MTPEILTHDTQTAEPGEFAKYLEAKQPTPAPVEPPVAPVAAAETPVETGPEPVKTEVWEDPETHDVIEKPGRADKRIKRLWSERQAAEARAVKAEAALAELQKTATGTPAGALPADAKPATTDPDALTMAAQARIRPKPDRGAIGTTYPTYEDYVEDCAVWGGELAAEKRAVRAESQAAEQQATKQHDAFAAAVKAAEADYDDFDEVTNQDLPVSRPMFDAITNSGDLAGHVQYWLGAHPEETRRIAALPPGPGLVAMGEVIATVKAARAAKAAPAETTPNKPRTQAPRPIAPAGRNGGAPTRPEQIAETGGNIMDYIRLKNEQSARRL